VSFTSAFYRLHGFTKVHSAAATWLLLIDRPGRASWHPKRQKKEKMSIFYGVIVLIDIRYLNKDMCKYAYDGTEL